MFVINVMLLIVYVEKLVNAKIKYFKLQNKLKSLK